MKKKNIIIIASVAVAIIIILIIVGRKSAKEGNANLFTQPSFGQFDIIVTTTGELEAESSVDITGPSLQNNRRMRMSSFEITDLVPEGTEVKAGDYVATLDRTTFENTLKDSEEELETLETTLEVTRLDTAVSLSSLRDNILNLRYSVEEAQITLDQSTYESPQTIRSAEIAVDKAKRTLEQAIKSYELSVEQAKSDMRKALTDVTDQRQYVNDLEKILEDFIVTAPSDGMVIYKKDRDGSKITIGSSINPFDNVVATLPDMSKMQSKTYVNEVDISKVKTGQQVEVEIDAFPENKYSGSVKSVANIGEQLPNADAKVFEVIVTLNESDHILKPAMTTSNKIITNSISDVMFIPLEAVQTGEDSIPFVYMKNGTKQVILSGLSNENNVIVEDGLEMGDEFYLNTPEDPDKFNKIVGEELIPVIKQRKADEEEAERKAQEAAQQPQQPGARGGFGGRSQGTGQFPQDGQMPAGGQFPPADGQMPTGGQFPQGAAPTQQAAPAQQATPAEQGDRSQQSGQTRQLPQDGQFPQGGQTQQTQPSIPTGNAQ